MPKIHTRPTNDRPSTWWATYSVETEGGFGLTTRWMGKCLTILPGNPDVKLQVTSALNLAILLLDPQDLELDCFDIVDLVYSSSPDLKDHLWSPGLGTLRMEVALWNKSRRRLEILWWREITEAKPLPQEAQLRRLKSFTQQGLSSWLQVIRSIYTQTLAMPFW